MNNKKKKQALSGMTGALLLLSGCAAGDPAAAGIRDASGGQIDAKTVETGSFTDPTEAGDGASAALTAENGSLSLNGYRLEAIESRADEGTVSVSNVEGTFSFHQEVLSPADDVLNLYGTAITGICAKPAFAFAENQEAGDYYINVSGRMKHSYSVSLQDLEEKEEQKIAACSCATSQMVVNAMVTGVPLKAVLELAELEEGANTVTVRGSDGYGCAVPLSYALEKDALLVYKINGETLPDGQSAQLWMPETAARYFTRDVVEIEVTAEEETPAVAGAEDAYRSKISILNDAGDARFTAGQEIVFEGYADDCGSAIAAIEFSLDGGETWTSYETKDATAERWVYWYFGFTPAQAGSYKLTARAVAADGTVSPLASTMAFEVEEAGL